jgi:putative YphP/YqiW family bacilliredoxin
MPYPEFMIKPMREELTRVGIEETRTPEEVKAAIDNTPGTVMVVVNSVCGCAAGKARPGIAMALQNEIKPEKVITVFAGADIEATTTARNYFTGYAPSSPSVGLLKDGKLVYMMERRDIETRFADQICDELVRAFNQHCAATSAANN